MERIACMIRDRDPRDSELNSSKSLRLISQLQGRSRVRVICIYIYIYIFNISLGTFNVRAARGGDQQ